MSNYLTQETADTYTLYISPQGSDGWTGRLPEPNAEKTDGPLASINGAHWAMRKLKEGGHISGRLTLCFRGGRYEMKQAIEITPRDGTPLTLCGYEGETAIISGGRLISGWEITSVNGVAAWVATIPEVLAGDWYFKQLFVNGKRRHRASLPKTGHFWMEDVPGLDLSRGMISQFIHGNDRFYANPEDLGDWTNIDDIDVVAYHYWVEERLPVLSLDTKTGLVVSSRRSIFVLRDDRAEKFAKYRLENVPEALTEPGEWYLDRRSGTLTYLPRPGEDPETAVVTAPVTDRLLVLRGTPAQPVTNVCVKNLVFDCTAWKLPGTSEREGIADTGALKPTELYGAATQAACNLGGVIETEYAQDCEISGCSLQNVGHYAIRLGAGSRRINIRGNLMRDMGAAGIKVNGGDAHSDSVHWNGEHIISDNEIVSGGRVFASAVGILMMHTFGNLVSHNHIHDLFYSGISCGWVWGYGPNISKDNRIEYNHIHTIGQGVLSDMGGIYTLGVQPGTLLRGNVIHDIKQCNYGGWCIYLDEGSSHMLVEGNTCYRAGAQGFNQHYGRENIVRNNVFAFGEITAFSLGRREDHNSLTFSHNICLTEGKPVYLLLPRGDDGCQGYRSDANLFWDVTGDQNITARIAPDSTGEYKKTPIDLAEWQKTGNDMFSRVADPLFKDIAANDFSVADKSPAHELGITLGNRRSAGPRTKPGVRA